jgi:hypothetical protein
MNPLRIFFLFTLCTASFLSPLARASTLGVIADIEGDWRKIHSFASNSNILTIKSDDPAHFDAELSGDSKLVFLGDSIDKGPNNLKVLSFLIYLKHKYPDRVVFIQGNRDANKLRFIWELKPQALALNDPAEHLSLDRFRLNSWAKAFSQFISTEALAQVDSVPTPYTHGTDLINDRILKMKWMLKDTMGCPTTFQDLKGEMDHAPDTAVAEQLLSWVSQEGLLAEYLRLSDLAYLDEPTGSLFVHGGISVENFGVIPESRLGRSDSSKITDVRAWIATLNAWSQARIQQGLAGDIEGALPLIQYQEPQVVLNAVGAQTWGLPNGISIAQGRPWSETFNLDPYHSAGLSPELIAHLQASGISKILFGHSPVGQVPVMMKSGDFLVVACDTSVTTPPRVATIEVSDSGVQITATYMKGATPVKFTANSADATTGTQRSLTMEDGTEMPLWNLGSITSEVDPLHQFILEVFYKKAPFGPFGLPTYR